MKFHAHIAFTAALATAVFLPAFAQQPLLHLPLDGSLDNRGSIGGAAQLFTADGAAQPTFEAGRFGQALRFDSQAAVAVPFELDHARYPRVTITAWVRDEDGASGTRTVLASGSTAGASLSISGRLAMRAGRTGVSFDQPVPTGEWVFVAGVVDTANGWARLQQNDDVFTREGIDTATKAPKKYRAPDDPESEPAAWLMVGAFTLNNWQQTSRALSIDDVRIYGEALSEAQIDAIRRAGAPAAVASTESTQPVTTQAFAISAPCSSNADCPAGSYCAQDETCHPNSHLPIAKTSDGTTLEEMQQRSAERNAGIATGVETQSPTGILPKATATPGDALKTEAVRETVAEGMEGKKPIELEYESEEAALEAQRRREEAAAAAESTGEPQGETGAALGEQRNYRIGFDAVVLRMTDVSGDAGDYSERIVFNDRQLLLQGMTTFETNDKPCRVRVIGGVHSGTRFEADNGSTGRFQETHPHSSFALHAYYEMHVCDEGLPEYRIGTRATELTARDFAGPITGIQVCTNGLNKRVKGLRARVRDISDPPDSTYAGSYKTRVLLERTNCLEWQTWVQCPSNTYAIGAQLHFRDGGLKVVAERDFLSGVALVCSDVEWIEGESGVFGGAP